MGEVYQATDTKLKRQVAIKALPESVAADPERLARFQREAETLAAINHPNIAIIHGLEQEGDVHALVMELVEGDDLSQRIARGAIPIDEALPIAKQIAEALEAAHEQGIIHRDLKPANIKVRPDGTVKVLDFGLAKAMEPTGAMSSEMSQSPTITTPAMTQAGMILGTAAYMSPEQAKGKTVDKRSDVWAFGAVLYEMLTGKRAFDGDGVSETLAKVIEREPDWDALPRNLPGRSRELLHRCLAKELRQRTPDIVVARQEIDSALAGSPDSTLAGATNPWRQPLPWIGVALLGASALWVSTLSAPTNAPLITRFQIAALRSAEDGFALSPDGSALVYPAQGHLWLRFLDDLEARPLPGTDGGRDPFFSPGAEWLAFFTATELKKMSFDGSAPVTVASVEDGHQGTWGRDGTIVFATRGPSGLRRVDASGGPPQPFAPLGDHIDILYPHALPEGDWVLYSDSVALQRHEIAAQSLVTGERKVVLELETRPRSLHFSETGQLLYSVPSATSPSGAEILAIPFDPSTLETSGPASPVLLDAALEFRVSSEGTLIHALGQRTEAQFVWLDEDGGEEPVTELAPRNDPINWNFGAALSPNGETLAFFRSPDIWLYDLESGSISRFTFDPALDIYPLWSADGERVAFTRQATSGEGGLFWKRADGSGEEERLTGEQVRAFSWTLDQKTLVVGRTCEGNSCTDIGLLSLDGDGQVVPLFESEAVEDQAALSADGRFIAYQSNESGAPRIYVRPFPDIENGRWQISPEDGAHPVWAPDGTKLYYRARDNILAVPIETSSTFSFGNPSVLLENRPSMTLSGVRDYSVSPDGERFMMVVGGGEPTRLIVVRNWFEELNTRLPPN